MARWFGRGDMDRERVELERLDDTASALQVVDPAEAEKTRIRQQAFWQGRFEAALESLTKDERGPAADQLRAMLVQYPPQSGTSAGPAGLAIGGNMDVYAEGGSIAAGVIHGGAHVGNPSTPAPFQG